MTDQKRPATLGQLVAVGFKVASTVSRTLSEGNLGFDEANFLVMNDTGVVEEVTKKICAQVFGIEIDPWAEEKRRIEKFYKKFFNRLIDWSKISVPQKRDKMTKLEVVLGGITEKDIWDVYAKQFGKSNLSVYGIIDRQQERPAADYAFIHSEDLEPDVLDKSYNQVCSSNLKLMLLKEGLIAAFRNRIETRRMYCGTTYFHSLDTTDCVFCMRFSGGVLVFDRVDKNTHSATSGFREICY